MDKPLSLPEFATPDPLRAKWPLASKHHWALKIRSYLTSPESRDFFDQFIENSSESFTDLMKRIYALVGDEHFLTFLGDIENLKKRFGSLEALEAYTINMRDSALRRSITLGKKPFSLDIISEEEARNLVIATRKQLVASISRFQDMDTGILDLLIGPVTIREAIPDDASSIATLYEKVWVAPDQIDDVLDETHEKYFSKAGGIFSKITEEEIRTMILNPDCVMSVAVKDDGSGPNVIGLCFGYAGIPDEDDGSVPHYHDFHSLRDGIDDDYLRRKFDEAGVTRFRESLHGRKIFLGGDIIAYQDEPEPLAHLLSIKQAGLILQKMPEIEYFVYSILSILGTTHLDQERQNFVPPLQNLPSQNFFRRLTEHTLGIDDVDSQKGDTTVHIRTNIYGCSIAALLNFCRTLERDFLDGSYIQMIEARRGRRRRRKRS